SVKQAFDDWIDRTIIDPQTKRSLKKEAIKLAAIIRLEATDAYNRGRLVAARDPRIKPFIKGMRSNAVLDDRTTEICRSLDGKIFLIDDPDLDNLRPPRHMGCRSWYTPVFNIEPEEVLTPEDIGRAKGLAGKGFAGFIPQ
ncbi:MAG: minor capsid protein, partial [Nitrososphaera sp.]